MIVALLAILLALPPRPVHIVFVVPPGEALTATERTLGTQAVADAIAWWQLDAVITSTSVITLTTNPYTSLEWARPWLHDANPDLTLFLIDNSASARWLFGDTVGEAQDHYGVIWAVQHGFPGADGLPATITHELGHAAYHLPDLPTGPIDIMRMPPTVAYRARFVGCASLAVLGRSCARLYAPMVTQQGSRLERAADPPLAVTTWAHDPQHLRPGQAFSIAAGVIGQASTVALEVPSWIEILLRTGGPSVWVYQVGVRENAALDSRGVITFRADGASASFVVSVCCAESPPAQRPSVLYLPIVRR